MGGRHLAGVRSEKQREYFTRESSDNNRRQDIDIGPGPAWHATFTRMNWDFKNIMRSHWS